MTKESLASLLNGREYGEEITKEEAKQAKSAGLVVVFGYSDDNVEFRGALEEEVGCHEGTTVYLTRRRVLPMHQQPCDCEYCGYSAEKEEASRIVTLWDKNGYSWMYSTEIPHACFDVMEGSECFCRGIVFNIEDLPK